MARNPYINEFGQVTVSVLLNIAEMLTLRLPEGTERIIAAKWVKKFQACKEKDYEKYLELFVSSLTKNFLVEPFDIAPQDMTSTWQGFQKEYNLNSINNAVVRRLYTDSFTPPYKIDISKDLTEYVAYQDVPFFGAHFYYAFSPTERIDKWSKFNKMNVPRHLVAELRADDPIDSPIQERFQPKSRERQSQLETTTIGGNRSRLAPRTPRAAWQGPIPEEPEPEPEAPRTAIVIPVGGTPKNIPAALQARMAKADAEAKERSARKQKGADATPRGRKSLGAKKTPFGKKLLRPTTDAVDSELISRPSTSSAPPPVRVEPEMPVFTGPQANIQKRLHVLRQSNPPGELIQATRDMMEASIEMNNEVERFTSERIANFENVGHIRSSGIKIGTNVLNMMKEKQAQDIQMAAEDGARSINTVNMTMAQLDRILAANRSQPNPELAERLERIKNQMQQSALEARSLVASVDEANAGEEIVNSIEDIVEINEEASKKLEEIQPATKEDVHTIAQHIQNNSFLSSTLLLNGQRLSNALSNIDPNISIILQQTTRKLTEIIEKCIEKDAQIEENAPPTEAAQLAIDIQDQKNQQIDVMKNKSLEIAQQVEQSVRAAASNILVARHLPIEYDSDQDPSAEILNIDEHDVDFGNAADEDYVRNVMDKSRRRKTLIEVDEDEQKLLNVSDTVLDGIDKSISEIEEYVLPQLQQIAETTTNDRDRLTVEKAIHTMVEEVANLEANKAMITDLIGATSTATLVPQDEYRRSDSQLNSASKPVMED